MQTAVSSRPGAAKRLRVRDGLCRTGAFAPEGSAVRWGYVTELLENGAGESTPSIGRCPSSISAAEVVGKNAVGVILTGMGKDGAQRACCACARPGAHRLTGRGVLRVYGMPREAARSAPSKMLRRSPELPRRVMALVGGAVKRRRAVPDLVGPGGNANGREIRRHRLDSIKRAGLR